jgi:hypothetical protein
MEYVLDRLREFTVPGEDPSKEDMEVYLKKKREREEREDDMDVDSDVPVRDRSGTRTGPERPVRPLDEEEEEATWPDEYRLPVASGSRQRQRVGSSPLSEVEDVSGPSGPPVERAPIEVKVETIEKIVVELIEVEETVPVQPAQPEEPVVEAAEEVQPSEGAPMETDEPVETSEMEVGEVPGEMEVKVEPVERTVFELEEVAENQPEQPVQPVDPDAPASNDDPSTEAGSSSIIKIKVKTHHEKDHDVIEILDD